MASKYSEAIAFVRAVLAVSRRLRAERPAGSITLAELSILSALHRLGPMPGNRLASAEGLQPQSLTRLLARLETNGLIQRSRGGTDRRELAVSITERGRHSLADGLSARSEWIERAMKQALDGSQRRALIQATVGMLKLAHCELEPDRKE